MKGWRGVERRKLLRLKSPLPVWFNLYHVLGRHEASRRLGGMISNVSLEGICLETNVVLVDGSHIFSEAMGEEKRLRVEIDLPPESERITAMGKVVWYDRPREIGHRFLFLPFPPHISLHPSKRIIGMLIAFINSTSGP
jgi:hypothetical protein